MDISKKIIVSIPFFSKAQFNLDIQDLIAINTGINLIEVRFDYWDADLSNELIQDVIRYLRSNQMKMIFTYKVQREYLQNHTSILHRLISHKPDYIDLDTNINASLLTELAQNAIENDVAIIYSYHNTEITPKLDIISDLCEFFIQMLPQFNANSRHILKMVFMSTKEEDSKVILEFCKLYGNKGFNLISFCMGEFGKNTRIQSILNGCSYTYAYIRRSTAAGQLSISEIKTYLLDRSDLNVGTENIIFSN